MEVRPGELEADRVPERSRFRYPHAIRLIRWIRAFVDSAAPFSQSITTASRSAVKREPGSVHGVVARTRLAALRSSRLAALLEEEHDRDVEDHVGGVRGAGVPGVLMERSRSRMPPGCLRHGPRQGLSGWGLAWFGLRG